MPLDFLGRAAAVWTCSLTATPDRVLEVDRFGNEYHIGRLGVAVNADENTIRHVRYNHTALWIDVEESYFIIEQTFVVLGRVIMGRKRQRSWAALFASPNYLVKRQRLALLP